MADHQTGPDADGEVEGVGTWETIAMLIMLAVLCMAIGVFAYGLTSHGISH